MSDSPHDPEGKETAQLSELPQVDITEFWQQGFIQEINRRFLHPLGMALFVQTDLDTGAAVLGGVFDYRSDPEGMIFGDGEAKLTAEDAIRAMLINEEWDSRKAARMGALGWMIEPLPNPAEELAALREPDSN